MNGITPSSAPALPEMPELRQAARALEGVFLSQLFHAMRATVPQGGVLPASSAQETFTAMFDEQIAEVLAQRTEGGLGDMLYEQLRRRIHDLAQTPSQPDPPYR